MDTDLFMWGIFHDNSGFIGDIVCEHRGDYAVI